MNAREKSSTPHLRMRHWARNVVNATAGTNVASVCAGLAERATTWADMTKRTRSEIAGLRQSGRHLRRAIRRQRRADIRCGRFSALLRARAAFARCSS